ncbi:hypothetical protein QFZ77_006622 [Paenibacillus sp. V4I3]|uniref:DUF3889 domain-containing protein n=1 Tax=unclassified Paenibacillus TaxID=185978 RepID=UPI002788D9AF|nr:MULTISPECIES: DUF3889 domain-containing protein [unclassified Paenibacillus]MDQ0877963.1 hypothetical protein [Paenibacillus sp. V4I3]MDQ0886211.1 hypothetical protein [Paenibacillus sp. V4I9]
MGRILAVLLIICFGWSGSLQAWAEASTAEIIVEYMPEQDPEYAKWSRLAFQEAGKLYTLLDYKYLGRSTIAPGVVQQQFRFWVRHHGVEFPLIVSIRYDPVTEKVFTIDMEQEKRGNLPIL